MLLTWGRPVTYIFASTGGWVCWTVGRQQPDPSSEPFSMIQRCCGSRLCCLPQPPGRCEGAVLTSPAQSGGLRVATTPLNMPVNQTMPRLLFWGLNLDICDMARQGRGRSPT